MNAPKASNAEETNDKLFGPYARKLESDDHETYITFSGKLAKWLADERAYYPTARPQILRLLKIAQLTLRRNVNANLDLKSPFHISSCLEHPMVAPYSKLLKAVHPHRDLFVEPDLHSEIKALLKTITTPMSSVHIDLTSELNSSVEPSYIHMENSTMQLSFSSLVSALQSPSFSLVDSSSVASFPHHSQPPNSTIQTNADSTTVVEVSGVSRGASDPSSPGNSTHEGFSTSPVYSGRTSFVENPNASFTPHVTSFPTSSHVPSASSPQLLGMTSEAAISSKVKKKKKKAGFWLESLIQADIQDLQKRGVAGVNIKVEPTNVTIPNLFDSPVSHSDLYHRQVIVVDDDEPARETAPPPSSSSTVQLVGQTGISETAIDGADTAVDKVSPHHAERPTSNTNGDNREDMAVDQVRPQKDYADIDVDMTDGTSETSLVVKGVNLPPRTALPLIHGWAPPKRLHLLETLVSTRVTANDSNLKAPASLEKDKETKPTRGGNSNVPDATEAKDLHSSENTVASCNATSNTSLDLNGSQSVTSDAGHVPSVTNGLYPVKAPEPASPETNNVHLPPNTLTTAPSTISSSENVRPSAPVPSQNSISPSPIVPTSVGGNNLLPTSSWMDVQIHTILLHLSPYPAPQKDLNLMTIRHPYLSANNQEPYIGLLTLMAITPDAFGPDTRALVYKGVNQKRSRFKIRFTILEEQYRAITRWNNRKNSTEDLSTCTCASLTCYSRASAGSEQKGINEIPDLPVIWPTGSSLSMNVMYNGRLTTFPLSPPFKSGPNGLVDLSEYIRLGENIIEFDQFDDMSLYIFVLRLHRPTGAQLGQVAERRQKNKAWDDWLLKMAEPMVVSYEVWFYRRTYTTFTRVTLTLLPLHDLGLKLLRTVPTIVDSSGMTDSHTGRLCVEIIHSHFGPITAVSSLILRNFAGLTFITLAVCSARSPDSWSVAPPPTIRTVLSSVLILIQHNLLWHARTDEDGEVLEVNVDECLMRLRFGTFVHQAEELFGKVASEIVQTILDHGKLRPPDVLSYLAVTLYTQTIHQLVSRSYLKPATVLSHVSPRDKRIQYEAEEKAKIVGFPTAKEIREAKEVAEARLKREEEEAEQVGLKRKAKETTGHRLSKRKVVEEEENVVEELGRLALLLLLPILTCPKLIIKATKERYNAGAALVLQAALKITESTQKNASEIRSGLNGTQDPMSVASITLQLSKHDLSSSLVFSSKKTTNSSCIKDYLGMLSAADNPTPTGRAGSFISFSSSKVQVEFEIIGRRLRRRVLESVTRERHGAEGVRILRLLLNTGKMDEKQVSKIAMMAPKDVRPLLAALAADSLISTQEVPKSADRNPTRTFYLWYVDLNKAYSVILGNLYKSLYNIRMRRRAEMEASDVKAVLEKRERSDVSQDEGLLSRLERDILKEWEMKQKKLIVLEMRVEETVFILKDLRLLGIDDD
ncbi:hypothetical protein C0995_001541 [Termitomyces sp. Mi166|nr:hypothetical protein C0995_001541 [Termitomyces sp. Mi166\